MKSGLIALLMVLGLASTVQAQDMGIVAGMRSDSADTDVSGASVNSKTNWQVGGVAKFDLHPTWQIRTGFIYLQRSYEYKMGTTSTDMKFTYFEVPVGILYKFSDFGGAFIGPALDMNVSKDCNSCTGVQSMVVPIQLGASFKFAPQVGMEFYFETGASKIADGLTSPKAVAVNLMITFD